MKKLYKRGLLLCLVTIALFLVYNLVNDIMTIYNLRSEIAIQEQLKEELEAEKKKIEAEIANLNNLEYVIRYAQGNYMFTQDGQTIIVLPEESTNQQQQ